jgi:hypothetical protein
MKQSNLILGLLAASFLAACGGGGGGSSSNGATSATSNNGATAATYSFITPKLGAQSVYVNSLVDNLGNTINRTVVDNVTAVNPDGTFTLAWNDPSNSSITTDVVNHTFYPSTENYNSVAQALNWTVTPSTGSPVNCVASPHGSGAPSPLNAGQNWAFNYTSTCDASSSTSSTQSGTFVGTESIIVPAGTFNAYKFQSTITSTFNATTTTASITQWRNAANADSRSLKTVVNYTYSGAAPPQGSLVSDTRGLQSYQ